MPFEYTLGAAAVADAVLFVFAEVAAAYDTENEPGPLVCED